MIKTHSDDPDVELAAQQALEVITTTLSGLPKATTFDYGGHNLSIGEYDVCTICTSAIAEAQQAQHAIEEKAEKTEDPEIKEHLTLAAHLLELEAQAAIDRAELHNGFGTEKILNALLGFIYDRHIEDNYSHNHEQGN